MSQRKSAAFLSDLPVDVVIELGRARLTIGDLAQLDRDSVVNLDRNGDAPLDIVVGGRVIARGEVVIVDERFVLRVTEIVDSPASPLDS